MSKFPKHLTLSEITPKYLVSLLSCGLSLLACSSGTEIQTESAELAEVASESNALLLNSAARLWAPNNRTIPMCWHQMDGIESKDVNYFRTFIQTAITEGWLNRLNLRATWEECPTSGTATHVRVYLRKGDTSYNGTTLAYGMDTLSTASARLVPPPKDPPGLLMAIPSNWNPTQFRSLVLHEFGHVLGFLDERCDPGAAPDPALVGPADPLSIMGLGYCPQVLGILSPANVREAQSIYGYGRSGSNDFNDDGRGDILWHNSVSHESQIWYMSGAQRFRRSTVLNEVGAAAIVRPPWSIVSSADFDGDQRSDILWHNSQSNETKLWFMNGDRIRTQKTVVAENGAPIFVGPPWNIVGSGDFNADGARDILWHNDTSNETQVWYMFTHKILSRATIQDTLGRNIYIGKPWTIVGTGDFNGDRSSDILWHNDTTNETQVWLMNGRKIATPVTIRDEAGRNIFVGLPWRIMGTNDFNQDGSSDILWHNTSDGSMQIWYLKGTSILRRENIDADLEGEPNPRILAPWSMMRQ